jgi:hypothetical protein
MHNTLSISVAKLHMAGPSVSATHDRHWKELFCQYYSFLNYTKLLAICRNVGMRGEGEIEAFEVLYS